MKSSKIYLLTILVALFSLPAHGQGLARLSQAPEISMGQFPNGITYYLVTNKAAYGYADYALVQKGAPEETKFRGELLSLSHFDGQKPYRFLASHGVGYKACGYVERGEDYTMYRFEDVPTSDVASSDTTLMMLFDLCELCPTEQAIIISGDIDASAIRGKMSIFSLMVSKRESNPAAPAYIWDPQLSSEIVTTSNQFRQVASITASFAAPRTSPKHLGTIQTLVSDMMFAELDLIARARIRQAFRTADIPLGGLVLRRKTAEIHAFWKHLARQLHFVDEHVIPAPVMNEPLGDMLPQGNCVAEGNVHLTIQWHSMTCCESTPSARSRSRNKVPSK
jgi:hypothetical protein